MTAAPHGPQFPTVEEFRTAQRAPHAAHLAGCTDAEYDRLVLQRHQTEAAYLEGHDRALVRAMDAEAARGELEPEAEL